MHTRTHAHSTTRTCNSSFVTFKVSVLATVLEVYDLISEKNQPIGEAASADDDPDVMLAQMKEKENKHLAFDNVKRKLATKFPAVKIQISRRQGKCEAEFTCTPQRTNDLHLEAVSFQGMCFE